MERAASAGSIIWGHKGLQGNSRPRGNSALATFAGVSQHQTDEKISASSSGYYGDIDSKGDSNGSDCQDTKTYKRRYYILALFALTAFMQYCCWNSFGPISTTCMLVFDWTEAEIAFMASLDPFTYIITMLMFSWLMDVKGLRLSMVLSAFFMAFGTGIRCLTSNNEYVTWSMAAGQFFNGLAGPVTQAAPTLLSTNWFPVHERTTATAIASLMGSFGVAVSFIIGPLIVREIDVKDYMYKDPFAINGTTTRYDGRELTPRTLADVSYREAKYYWPFDNEYKFDVARNRKKNRRSSNAPGNKKSRRAQRNFDNNNNYDNAPQIVEQKLFQEYKSNNHGRGIGKLMTSRGVFGDGVTTLSKKGWINLGDFDDQCLGKPALCKNGLSVAFWVNLSSNISRQFLLGTGGLKSRRDGFLVSTKRSEENTTFMKVDVIEKMTMWRAYFPVFPSSWNHIAFTWNRSEGLRTYLNSSLVAHTTRSSQLHSNNAIRGKSLTVGRVNNAKRYCTASFDEVALWEKTLQPEEVTQTYRNAIRKESSAEEKLLLEDLEKVKEDTKKDIMYLMYGEFGINALVLILICVYFPDRPPVPPTKSSYVERADFSIGVRKLIRSPTFWTLCLIYGITTGVYSGWGSLLNVNLSAFGISQKEAGWLGFYSIIVGVVSGMILARCADLFTGRMKALLLLLFIGASGCFLWFTLLCLKLITYSRDSLYKAAILGGFFISGTIPLFYELTVEQVYPIAEGVTIGVMTLVNNVVTVIFLTLLMIPNLGTLWMNWALCGSCIVCLPVLLMFKEQYNRLNVDMHGKIDSDSLQEKDPPRKPPILCPNVCDNHTDESDVSDSGVLLSEKTKMLDADECPVAGVAEPTGMTLLTVPDTQYGVDT